MWTCHHAQIQIVIQVAYTKCYHCLIANKKCIETKTFFHLIGVKLERFLFGILSLQPGEAFNLCVTVSVSGSAYMQFNPSYHFLCSQFTLQKKYMHLFMIAKSDLCSSFAAFMLYAKMCYCVIWEDFITWISVTNQSISLQTNTYFHHWKLRVIMMPTLPSLVTPGWCHQWWQSWHHDDSGFSIDVIFIHP